MYIIDNGLYIPTFDETKDSVKTYVVKKAPKHLFSEEDKSLYNLDVRDRAELGNSLPYDIYHLIQNCVFAKEMIHMMTVAYEGTNEVKATRENSLNRKYEHFFAQWNESLNQTFNNFSYLINNMRIFDIFKHESVLVLKSLYALDDT